MRLAVRAPFSACHLKQFRREGAIEDKISGLQGTACRMGFLDTLFREVGIFPSGEEIFQIPIALAMPHENEKPLHF